MRDRFTWIEWLKNVPGWAKAGVGLIGLLAAFIIAFRENWWVYSTVSVLVILMSLLGASIYILLVRKPARSKKKKGAYRYEKQRPLGIAGIAIALVTLFGLSIAAPTRQVAIYALRGTPTPTPLPALESADVLITEFDARYASRTMDIAHRLERDLQQRLKSFGMENVTVQVMAQPIADESEAQTAANKTGSKVVIWGWYDDAGIQVRLFLSGGNQAGREIPGTSEIPLESGGTSTTELSFVVRDVLPENVSFLSLFVIGHLNYLANDYEAGHRAFDAAMNNMPETVALENAAILHFFQARQLDADGADLADVICEYAKAIELDPGFAEPYNNLGVVLSRLYEKGIRTTPIPSNASACLAKAGFTDKDSLYPSSLYQRAFDLDSRLTIADFNRAASEWESAPNNYWGRSTFERIQQQDPSIVGTYLILAIMNEWSKDYVGAIQMYEAGIKVDPNNAALHLNLGRVYLQRYENENKAEPEFRAAVNADPKNYDAQLALANLLYGQGKLDEAATHVEAVLSSGETAHDPFSLRQAALVLHSGILFGQDNVSQAIEVLKTSIEGTAHRPLELYLLGLLYQSLGQNTQVVETFGSIEDWPVASDVNLSSEMAWSRILDRCHAHDSTYTFNVWLAVKLPSDNCLPLETKQRINAVYNIFHEAIKDREILRMYVDTGLACPYVYVYDPATESWRFQTTVLYNLKYHEATQVRLLNQFDGLLLIREQEPEVSYINQLYVIARLADGTSRLVQPQVEALKSVDQNYVILHQGDQVVVSFDDFPLPGKILQWQAVATGYYIPSSP